MRLRIAGRDLFWHGLLPALLGGVHTFAFAPYYNWPLTLAVYAGLYGLAWRSRGRPGAAFCIGFSFGAGLFLVGSGWFLDCVREFYASNLLHAAALMAVFIIVMAGAHTGIPLAFAAWLERSGRAARRLRALSFGVSITLADWLRAWLFTGFSWFEPGYAHSWPSPLAKLLPYGGVHLATLASLLFSAMLFELARASWLYRHTRSHAMVTWAIAIGLLAAAVGSLPVDRLPEREEPISARLVQGNVNKRLLDHDVFVSESVETYLPPLLDPGFDLVVVPEGAFPGNVAALPVNVLQQIEQATTRHLNTAIFGGYLYGDQAIWNAAIAISGDRIQSYRKRHLIPFAEYTPAWFKGLVPIKRLKWGEFAPGHPEQEPLAVGKDSAALSICYEAMFGEEFAYGAPRATFLVSINNLVWLGTRSALNQHLQLNQVRAAEYGKPMLQVSNTGLTAHIDAAGRVVASTGGWEAAELRVRFKGRVGATWYARYGNYPLLIGLFAFLAGLVILGRWRPAGAPELAPEARG